MGRTRTGVIPLESSQDHILYPDLGFSQSAHLPCISCPTRSFIKGNATANTVIRQSGSVPT